MNAFWKRANMSRIKIRGLNINLSGFNGELCFV